LPNSPLFFIFAAISEPLRINRRSLAIFPDYELATRQRLRSLLIVTFRKSNKASKKLKNFNKNSSYMCFYYKYKLHFDRYHLPHFRQGSTRHGIADMARQWRQSLNGKSWRSNFPSATHAPATNHESHIRIRTQNDGQQIGSGRNSSTERAGKAIPTSGPHLLTTSMPMPDSDMASPTLADTRNSKWRTPNRKWK
jgi:hypothetical protein